MEASPRYVWYGDDFTGASDTLATVAQSGLRTILFCGLPTPEQLRRAGPLDALGIAGAARSMAPDAMRAELAKVGPFLARSGARIVHYKCCSTFDSAPHVGSIGVAARSLREFTPGNPVLIVGGQPSLGRYCIFGELFAVAQPAGPVYRIDRHPTMSRHPVTPMHEADLRRHLAQQGMTDIGLVDLRRHDHPDGVDVAVASSPDFVLFDVAHERDLAAIGRVAWSRAQRAPVLMIGASSVAQSLIGCWGSPLHAHDRRIAPATSPVLVLAGSLSPVTAAQIERASSYVRVPLAPGRLASDEKYLQEQARVIVESLRAGRHTLAYTSPVSSRQPSLAAGVSGQVAAATSALLRSVLRGAAVTRIGIAGGDTSSHAVEALECWGLEWLGGLDNGVSLLRARADDTAIDGLQLMLKGGQMGREDLLETLIRGSP